MTDSPRLEAERLAKALGKAIRVAVDGKLSFASVDVDELARLAVAYSGVVTSIQGGQELNRLLLALLYASADKNTQRAITFTQEMKRIGLEDETRDAGMQLIAKNANLRDSTEKSRRAYFTNP
jgi:hypothetical protein